MSVLLSCGNSKRKKPLFILGRQVAFWKETTDRNLVCFLEASGLELVRSESCDSQSGAGRVLSSAVLTPCPLTPSASCCKRDIGIILPCPAPSFLWGCQFKVLFAGCAAFIFKHWTRGRKWCVRLSPLGNVTVLSLDAIMHIPPCYKLTASGNTQLLLEPIWPNWRDYLLFFPLRYKICYSISRGRKLLKVRNENVPNDWFHLLLSLRDT